MNKSTSLIVCIAAVAVAAAPMAANARPHHDEAGAVIAGLAVGLGIGVLAATASPPPPVVYRQETVVVSQPQPVYYPPQPVVYPPQPVVYQQQQVYYQNVPQVIYTPPSQTVIYTQPDVIYYPAPSYQRSYYYREPYPRHFAPPPRYRDYPSHHGGDSHGRGYGPPPSSHRWAPAPQPAPQRGGNHRF